MNYYGLSEKKQNKKEKWVQFGGLWRDGDI